MSKKRAMRRGTNRTVKRRPSRYETLARRQRDIYDRATSLLTDLRRGEGPYSKLLRKYRLGNRTARKVLGRDVLGGGRGRPVRASKADRRVRDLLFPTRSGDVPIRTRSSRDATKLSDYFKDRDRLLRDKVSADDFEAKWRGVRVAGQELFADPEAIFQMANAGDLKVETLYASTGGAR